MRITTMLGLVIATLLAGCDLEDKDGQGDGDAGSFVDAPSGAAGVCERICRHVFVDCLQDEAGEEECRSGCEADLVDCSPAQLALLDECSVVPCMPGDTDPVLACIMRVACVDS